MRVSSLFLLATLVAIPLSGQEYSGTYHTTNDQGEPVTLVLEQNGQGVAGTLTAPGVTFQVEGFLETGGAMGAIYNDQIGIYFYANLAGSRLALTLVELDAHEQPDFGRTTELVFTRNSAGDRPEALEAPASGSSPPPSGTGGSSARIQPPGPTGQALISAGLAGDPTLGYFFRAPEGWGANQQGSLFLLGSDTHHGMILVLPHELGSLEALRAGAAEGLQQDGVSLRLSGPVEPFGERGIFAEYDGLAQGQPATGRAVGLLSPYGGGVTIIALVARASYRPEYRGWVEEIARSMEFRAPETGPIARQWDGEVRGRHLKFMESYYSQGGAGVGGYNLERSLYLCSNGEYLYRDSSLISADAGGASAMGHGRGGETGRWEVTARGQDGVLRLTSQEGGIRQYVMTWRNNLIHLDGERYFRDTNDVCP